MGFIQYPKSPRYVAPEVAAAIIAWVYGPEPVGVFVNEEAETVNRVAEAAHFALVQLHGDEPPELCARIDRPVIKAFRIPPEATVDQMRRQMEPYREHAACAPEQGGRAAEVPAPVPASAEVRRENTPPG